jgi:hypothetical protein
VTEEHVDGRRWRSTRRRPRQMKEAAGSVLQWFLAVDGGSAAGLAWLRCARERCTMVSAWSRGAWREAEWSGERSAPVAERGENGLFLRADSERRRRTERTWRPVDSAGARRWQWLSSYHASDQAPFKRRLRLTSGPRHFFIY